MRIKQLLFTYLVSLSFATALIAENRKQLLYITNKPGIQHYQKALDDVAIFTKALKLTPREKVEALLYLDTLVRCKNSELYQQRASKANKLLTFIAHHANELQKLTSPIRGIVQPYQLSLPQQFILESVDIIQQVKNGTAQSSPITTPTTLKIAYNNALDRLHTIILYQTQQLNDTEFNDFISQIDQLGNTYLTTVVQKSIPNKSIALFRQLENLYRDIINKNTPEPLQKTAQELADKFVHYAKETLATYRQSHLPY